MTGSTTGRRVETTVLPDGVLCEDEDATLAGSYNQSPHPWQQK